MKFIASLGKWNAFGQFVQTLVSASVSATDSNLVSL